LGEHRPQDAVTALQPATSPALRDFWAPYLRGQAFLETKSPDLAAADFQKIIANRGVDGLSPLYPLAYLGLARALRMQGKLAESRTAYETLFAFWKTADDNLPALLDARAEYAKLLTFRQAAEQKTR
jgi:predicted Zn-dependent protease